MERPPGGHPGEAAAGRGYRGRGLARRPMAGDPARHTGHQLAIVDTTPGVEHNMADTIALCRDAAFVLVPTSPSTDDLESVAPWFRNLTESGARGAFVLNKANRRTKSFAAARSALLRHGPVAPVEIPRSGGHRRALRLRAGRGGLRQGKGGGRDGGRVALREARDRPVSRLRSRPARGAAEAMDLMAGDDRREQGAVIICRQRTADRGRGLRRHGAGRGQGIGAAERPQPHHRAMGQSTSTPAS